MRKITGTSNGNISDLDSNFKPFNEESDKNTIMVFSFIGMKTKEIAIDSKKIYIINLRNKSEELDEVIIMGCTKKSCSLQSYLKILISKTKTYLFAEGINSPSYMLKTLNIVYEPTAIFGDNSSKLMISYFSRLNFNSKHKYYISTSFRRDGFSKLGINKRWANFYSISSSWRITEENLLKDIK